MTYLCNVGNEEDKITRFRLALCHTRCDDHRPNEEAKSLVSKAVNENIDDYNDALTMMKF
jgi:hypothetical protein